MIDVMSDCQMWTCGKKILVPIELCSFLEALLPIECCGMLATAVYV